MISFSFSPFAGPLCVVDVRGSVRGNADYAVAVKDITQWENAHGRIPNVTYIHTHIHSHTEGDAYFHMLARTHFSLASSLFLESSFSLSFSL